METFKILFSTAFYPPYHLGGDATHVRYLAEELAKEGHEIHVIHSLDAYRIKRPTKKVSVTAFEKTPIHIHSIQSFPSFKDPILAYVFGRSHSVEKKFQTVLDTEKPEIVHHHNISLLGYSILKKKGKYLSLHTAHDYWLICQTSNLMKNNGKICEGKNCFSCAIAYKRFPQLWRYTGSFKESLKGIDLLISPSDYLRKRLLQELDIKSITIPNFVSPPRNIVSKCDFSNYFLFVGMLEKHKGILNLLQIFNKNRHEIKANLVIVGGGSQDGYIKSFIRNNSLGNKIFFLGFVDQDKLDSLYVNALALIVPSIWPENAPLVTLEALSKGTPVIGSNNGGLPEILEKVDKRLIFSNEESLLEILLNFSRKKYPAEKIRAIWTDNFSPKIYVKKYIEIIKSSEIS